MKKVFTILLLFTTILFAGCTVKDNVNNHTDMEKISDDKVTYEIFQDGFGTVIQDEKEINKFKKVINSVLKNANGQAKCYINNEHIAKLKNKVKVLEVTHSEEQDLFFKYSDGAESTFDYIKIYLYENSKEATGYSFIIEDKENNYTYLYTDFNYTKIFN